MTGKEYWDSQHSYMSDSVQREYFIQGWDAAKADNWKKYPEEMPPSDTLLLVSNGQLVTVAYYYPAIGLFANFKSDRISVNFWMVPPGVPIN